MKYRRLPLEREEVGRPQTEIEEARGLLLQETMSTKGFQIVTAILRGLEAETLRLLRCGGFGARVDLGTGRLQVIEEIRRSLRAILPKPQQAAVDWFDDEHEGYTVDATAPDDDNG